MVAIKKQAINRIDEALNRLEGSLEKKLMELDMLKANLSQGAIKQDDVKLLNSQTTDDITFSINQLKEIIRQD